MGDKNVLPDSTNSDPSPDSPGSENKEKKAQEAEKDQQLASTSKPSIDIEQEPTKQDSDIQQTSKQQPASETTSIGQNKIEVLFRNTGNAPIMKKSKWAVNSSFTVADSVAFIRKYLKLDQSLSIFIYVNQSFAPALDQTIQNLFDCYESDKKLVLYYATVQAWG